MRAYIVDGENIGVIKRAVSPRLLLEPSQPVRIAAEVGGQDFDRNFPPQPRILRPIHFPHAARAQRRDDLIGPDFCTTRQCHSVPDYIQPAP